MADYCTRTDIDDIFGADQVSKWANLSNGDPEDDAVAAEIDGRVAKAIEYATADIHDTLRGGPYSLPIASPGAAVTMRGLCASLAGVWLYENRGVVDYNAQTKQAEHRYQWRRDEVRTKLKDIRANKLRLDAARGTAGTLGMAPAATQSPPTNRTGIGVLP